MGHNFFGDVWNGKRLRIHCEEITGGAAKVESSKPLIKNYHLMKSKKVIAVSILLVFTVSSFLLVAFTSNHNSDPQGPDQKFHSTVLGIKKVPPPDQLEKPVAKEEK